MSTDSVAQDQLQSFVRRIEALEDEIGALNGDKSEVYKEAKGNGFDTKVLRKVIADRRKDASERALADEIYQLYWDAIHVVVRAHVENIEVFGVDNSAENSGRGTQEPSISGALSRSTTFDAETGEVIEPEAAMLPQTAGSETAVAKSEADTAEQPVQHVGAATSFAGTGADEDRHPIPDISKPNPICRDPDDCGVYASWHMPCLNCQRAASLRNAA